MNSPSPYLRSLVTRTRIVDKSIIDVLVDMSDEELTRLITGLSASGADCPKNVDSTIYQLAVDHSTSGGLICECIKARVLDRWIEENGDWKGVL